MTTTNDCACRVWRGGRIERIPDCTHGHTLVESGRMAEVSQAKIGPDDDVSATPKDPRIEWRNYKFVPYPQRVKPRSNFCDKITFGHMSQVAKDGFYRPPLNFQDVSFFILSFGKTF